MPPSSTISCALKFLDYENQVSHGQCEFVTENIELRTYCPSVKGGLPSSEMMSTLCMLNATFSPGHPNCKEVVCLYDSLMPKHFMRACTVNSLMECD